MRGYVVSSLEMCGWKEIFILVTTLYILKEEEKEEQR